MAVKCHESSRLVCSNEWYGLKYVSRISSDYWIKKCVSSQFPRFEDEPRTTCYGLRYGSSNDCSNELARYKRKTNLNASISNGNFQRRFCPNDAILTCYASKHECFFELYSWKYDLTRSLY